MSAPLILASSSPQRTSLLLALDVDFDVVPSGLQEEQISENDPLKRATLLAQLKAESVASIHPGTFVIGCDTLVVAADGSLLEKPRDEHEARSMLQRHSGRTCIVHSAVCVIAPGGAHFEGVSTSSVTFKKLSVEDMDWWISTGLWKDRSGAFQIDGPGQLMIEKLEGDFTGVVGLPIFLLGQLLRRAGYTQLASL